MNTPPSSPSQTLGRSSNLDVEPMPALGITVPELEITEPVPVTTEPVPELEITEPVITKLDVAKPADYLANIDALSSKMPASEILPKTNEDVDEFNKDVTDYNIQTSKVNKQAEIHNKDINKYNEAQEKLNKSREESDSDDILMIALPAGAVASKSMWSFSRVTFMVIIIIVLLMIIFFLYITDIPYIAKPLY